MCIDIARSGTAKLRRKDYFAPALIENFMIVSALHFDCDPKSVRRRENLAQYDG